MESKLHDLLRNVHIHAIIVIWHLAPTKVKPLHDAIIYDEKSG